MLMKLLKLRMLLYYHSSSSRLKFELEKKTQSQKFECLVEKQDYYCYYWKLQLFGIVSVPSRSFVFGCLILNEGLDIVVEELGEQHCCCYCCYYCF